MTQDRDETGKGGRAATGRALMVLETAGAEVPALSDRPLAGFVAQLIACGRRLPAYRAKGRATPDVATRSYGRDDGSVPARGRFDLVV